MSPWRFLFPSFERPVGQRRYLQLEPRRRHSSGIWAVLGLSAVCGGVFLALPAAPQRPTPTPSFLVAAPVKAQPDVAGTATASDAGQTTADAADGDLSLQQLSALCGSDRPTARRVCVEAKAARDAKLEEVVAQAKAKASADEKAAIAAKAAADARAEAALASAGQSSSPSQSSPQPAAQQKSKTALETDKRPVETLVHVYDQVAPDGRVVPVYRSSDGSYRFGAPQGIPEDRRAELQPRGFFSFFGTR